HYPPPAGPVSTEEKGAGAHTGFGCFTLLAQDEVSGPQARHVAGEGVEIPPRPDTPGLQPGGMFPRWTHRPYVSLKHPRAQTTPRARYSIAFFYDPNYDATIEVLPTCVSAERPARYPPTTGGGHIMERLSAGYGFDIVKGTGAG